MIQYALLGCSIGSLCLLSFPVLGQTMANSQQRPKSQNLGIQTAVLAGGCFWGMEAVFEHLQGVKEVTSGFAGGDARAATYTQVTSGRTGHAEAVQITFDPKQISYNQLLSVYFRVAHNPTELNRQGPDQGSQYRSAIFFTTAEQQRLARATINGLTQAKAYSQPIVTQVVPLQGFYPAEPYHQDFVRRNPNHPYVVFHDRPKLAKLQAVFPGLYRPGTN
jgi:peptide-methionine (S)-S-oxide reductase